MKRNHKFVDTEHISMVIIPDIDYESDHDNTNNVEIEPDYNTDSTEYDVEDDYNFGPGDGLEILDDSMDSGRVDTRAKNKTQLSQNPKFTLKDAKNIAKQLGVMNSNYDTNVRDKDRKDNFNFYNNNAFENDNFADDDQCNTSQQFDIVSMPQRRECWAKQCRKHDCKIHAKELGDIISEQTGLSGNKNKNVELFKLKLSSLYDITLVWSRDLRRIEGFYGPGIVSYFYFLRWLLFLNILITISVVLVIILPQLVFVTVNVPISNITEPSNDTIIDYTIIIDEHFEDNQTEEVVGINSVADFFQGTGWMEKSYTFIGFYKSKNVRLPVINWKFNTTVAYLLCTIIYFFICFVVMLIYTTKGMRDALLTRHQQQYAPMILCGWEFSTQNEKRYHLKQSSLTNEIKSCQLADQNKEIASNRKPSEKAKIILIRIAINVLVLSLLGASLFAIGKVTAISIERDQTGNDSVGIIIEYSPMVLIFAFYLILPEIFNYLIKYEKYISQATVIKVNLVRMVLLRLASVFVLLISLFVKLSTTNVNRECWENLVGQSLYKLLVGDIILETIFILVFDTLKNHLIKRNALNIRNYIDYQRFDIPKNVLSLVYIQMLCWLGTFYCPFLPVICIIRLIALYYCQKFTLFNNCVQPDQPYRTSRSNIIFISVLIFAYFISAIPIAYTIGSSNREPSHICSPFAAYRYKWQPIEIIVSEWPTYIQTFTDIITSTASTLLIAIFLCLLTYYYYVRGLIHKHMIDAINLELKQIALDRNYLMNQLAIIYANNNIDGQQTTSSTQF